MAQEGEKGAAGPELSSRTYGKECLGVIGDREAHLPGTRLSKARNEAAQLPYLEEQEMVANLDLFCRRKRRSFCLVREWDTISP
jgi:hypothetical protein